MPQCSASSLLRAATPTGGSTLVRGVPGQYDRSLWNPRKDEQRVINSYSAGWSSSHQCHAAFLRSLPQDPEPRSRHWLISLWRDLTKKLGEDKKYLIFAQLWQQGQREWGFNFESSQINVAHWTTNVKIWTKCNPPFSFYKKNTIRDGGSTAL